MFQNATQNCLELIDDPKAAAVDEIAAKLGLCKVGLRFSSLLSLTVPTRCVTKSEFWFSVVLSGLQVGWIFTDLLSEDTRIGTVRYTRNKVRTRLKSSDQPVALACSRV